MKMPKRRRLARSRPYERSATSGFQPTVLQNATKSDHTPSMARAIVGYLLCMYVKHTPRRRRPAMSLAELSEGVQATIEGFSCNALHACL